MTTYKLQITIDNTGLQTISNARASIAILMQQDLSPYQIVAVLADPLNNTQVTWTDTVNVYTSLSPLADQQVITINSFLPAYADCAYSYDGTCITATGAGTSQTSVQLANASKTLVTAGLAKVFTVNSNAQKLAATTASSLLPSGLGTFALTNTIIVTLMTGVEVGMAVPIGDFPDFTVFALANSKPQITAQPGLVLNFSPANATQNICFNDTSCMFYAC